MPRRCSNLKLPNRWGSVWDHVVGIFFSVAFGWGDIELFAESTDWMEPEGSTWSCNLGLKLCLHGAGISKKKEDDKKLLSATEWLINTRRLLTW